MWNKASLFPSINLKIYTNQSEFWNDKEKLPENLAVSLDKGFALSGVNTDPGKHTSEEKMNTNIKIWARKTRTFKEEEEKKKRITFGGRK
jgi:hypothetical protein